MQEVVSIQNSGLCNRLKSLLSAMRLNHGAKVLWEKTKYVNCKFNDLFENDIEIKKVPKDAIIYNNWRFLVLPEDNISMEFAKARPDTLSASIDMEYERIPEKLRLLYTNITGMLTPVKYIRDEIKQYVHNFSNDTISVSVRSWKSVLKEKNPKFKERIDASRLDNFFEALDSFKQSRFFVSCDDEEYLEKILKRYGQRVIYRNKSNYGFRKSNADTIINNLIDMYLLGKNSLLIGSYLSTFSELAWWFGGCRQKSIIVDSSVRLKIEAFINEK